jgi:hypothetical protein
VRLVTLVLTAAMAATAQTPGSLPWASARVPPWNAGPGAPAAPASFTPTQTALPLTVHLAQDGALRILDDKGILRLRMGLPGRPVKLWRDWGTPVPVSTAETLHFPATTPLLGGIGALPVGAPDFRPALEGLLWVLDDDEKVVSLIHPASARAVFLPLPGGRNLTLVFHPDRLEVQKDPSDPEARTETTCWSIPWLALLPQFIQLGQEGARHRPEGTVLLPFPKE